MSAPRRARSSPLAGCFVALDDPNLTVLDRAGPHFLWLPALLTAASAFALINGRGLRGLALLGITINVAASAIWWLAGGWLYFLAGP